MIIFCCLVVNQIVLITLCISYGKSQDGPTFLADGTHHNIAFCTRYFKLKGTKQDRGSFLNTGLSFYLLLYLEWWKSFEFWTSWLRYAPLNNHNCCSWNSCHWFYLFFNCPVYHQLRPTLIIFRTPGQWRRTGIIKWAGGKEQE